MSNEDKNDTLKKKGLYLYLPINLGMLYSIHQIMMSIFKRISSLHQLQRKQTWFVLLMVFIMSWSGVAVASVKNMHAGMIQNGVQPIQHSSNGSPCHNNAMQHINAQNMQHGLKHLNQTMMHCDQQTQLHSSTISQSCQDCHQLHCQNLNSYAEHVIPALPQQTAFAAISDSHTDYRGQHFSGFWQEILRPPKA